MVAQQTRHMFLFYDAEGRLEWANPAFEEITGHLLADVVGAVRHVLSTDSLSGPINVTSPGPVTNTVFTKELGRALHRPTLFPMPAFAAKLALGEMAGALLLSSARVEPKKLLASGYVFRTPTLKAAFDTL